MKLQTLLHNNKNLKFILLTQAHTQRMGLALKTLLIFLTRNIRVIKANSFCCFRFNENDFSTQRLCFKSNSIFFFHQFRSLFLKIKKKKVSRTKLKDNRIWLPAYFPFCQRQFFLAFLISCLTSHHSIEPRYAKLPAALNVGTILKDDAIATDLYKHKTNTFTKTKLWGWRTLMNSYTTPDPSGTFKTNCFCLYCIRWARLGWILSRTKRRKWKRMSNEMLKREE